MCENNLLKYRSNTGEIWWKYSGNIEEIWWKYSRNMDCIQRKYGRNMDCIWQKYGVLEFVSVIKVLIMDRNYEAFDKVKKESINKPNLLWPW